MAKKLENKETKIETLIDPQNVDGGVKNATYADLISQALKASRPEGYNLDELKKRFRVIDVMDEAKKGKDIILEDADAAFLQTMLKDFTWLVVDRDLVNLVEDVLAMKKVPPKK